MPFPTKSVHFEEEKPLTAIPFYRTKKAWGVLGMLVSVGVLTFGILSVPLVGITLANVLGIIGLAGIVLPMMFAPFWLVDAPQVEVVPKNSQTGLRGRLQAYEGRLEEHTAPENQNDGAMNRSPDECVAFIRGSEPDAFPRPAPE